MTPLWVALAGGAGAALRLVVDGVLTSILRPTRWPVGTMTVNLSGSLALGLVVGADLGSTTTTVLGAGLLGGYTTASTISFEVAQRALTKRPLLATAVATVTLATCVVGAAVGRSLV